MLLSRSEEERARVVRDILFIIAIHKRLLINAMKDNVPLNFGSQKVILSLLSTSMLTHKIILAALGGL